MAVIDAGVIVNVLRGEIDPSTLVRPLFAPHLLDGEVVNALRRLVAARQIDAAAAELLFQGFTGIVIRRRPATLLLPRMWELRHNLSGYDATYVAMAESLEDTLVTTDRRLAAAPGLRCRIEVV